MKSCHKRKIHGDKTKMTAAKKEEDDEEEKKGGNINKESKMVF